MKAASSGVTRSGKPSAFCRVAAEPRSACARCAAGVNTVSKLSAMADLLSANLGARTPGATQHCVKAIFLLDHLAAFFADLVLVIFKARQQHARVLAFALAELGHIRPAGGALLRRALGKRESRYNGHGDNDEDKTQGHQRSLFCGAARKHPPIMSPTWPS